jgi:Uma2 family endonuclease
VDAAVKDAGWRRARAGMTVNQRLMTAEELLCMPDDGMRHELVRGELRTMPPGGWGHGKQSTTVVRSLGDHVAAHDLGEVATNEPGFLLATNPDTVRAPDVAFVRRERLLDVNPERGYYPGPPDLAVEVISPNDLYTEVEEKVAEWLAYGTRMMLVVNPRQKTVAVHRNGSTVRILGPDDTIDGEDVVPGWTLPVRDLFGRP